MRVERQEGAQCAEVEVLVEVLVAELLEEGEGSEAIEGVEEALVEVGGVDSAPAAAVVVVVMQISQDLQEAFVDGGHSIYAGCCGAWIAFGMLHNGMDPHVDLCESLILQLQTAISPGLKSLEDVFQTRAIHGLRLGRGVNLKAAKLSHTTHPTFPQYSAGTHIRIVPYRLPMETVDLCSNSSSIL